MTREITFDIATQYSSGPHRGYYNPTINWGRLAESLNFLGRYWNVSYRRVSSGGRVRFIQSNTQPNPDWMMWTRGWSTFVSPTRNFGRNDYASARYWCHEHLHQIAGGSHVGGNDALMSVFGGVAPNLTQLDYPYMRSYARRPGAKLPHEEPTAFRDAFSTVANVRTFTPNKHETMMDAAIRPSFGWTEDSERKAESKCNSKPTFLQRLFPSWVP